MPEGDAVRRTALRLDRALAGERLVRAELRVPRFATVDLRGATVLGTATVGKHLLTRLDRDGRALTLHHHLRMDGTWRIGPPGPPRAPGHLIRIWLATDRQQAVGVHVHMVEVRRTADESAWIGHLGPDILAPGFDAQLAADRLAETGRPLVEALLDQSMICGLGTIWAAETAAAAGVDPDTPADRVPRLADALAAIATRMDHAVTEPPMTTRRQHLVYEREGQPCRTCGTVIRRRYVGQAPTQRRTFWCPTCQPPIPA